MIFQHCMLWQSVPKACRCGSANHHAGTLMYFTQFITFSLWPLLYTFISRCVSECILGKLYLYCMFLNLFHRAHPPVVISDHQWLICCMTPAYWQKWEEKLLCVLFHILGTVCRGKWNERPWFPLLNLGICKLHSKWLFTDFSSV